MQLKNTLTFCVLAGVSFASTGVFAMAKKVADQSLYTSFVLLPNSKDLEDQEKNLEMVQMNKRALQQAYAFADARLDSEVHDGKLDVLSSEYARRQREISNRYAPQIEQQTLKEREYALPAGKNVCVAVESSNVSKLVDSESINDGWTVVQDDIGDGFVDVTHEKVNVAHALQAAKGALKKAEKDVTYSPAFAKVLVGAQKAVLKEAEERHAQVATPDITLDVPKIVVKQTALQMLGDRVMGHTRAVAFNVNNAFKAFGRWLCS